MFGGRGEAAWQGGSAGTTNTAVCALVTRTHCCWDSLPQTAARDAVLVINVLR